MFTVQAEVANALDLLGGNYLKVQHALPVSLSDKAASDGTAECVEAAYTTIHAFSRPAAPRSDASAIQSLLFSQ